MIKPSTVKPFIQMNLRPSKSIRFNGHSRLWLYAEFFNRFNRADFCNSYEEDVTDPHFNQPRAFCNWLSNAIFGGVSGFNAFAIPFLHTQLGLTFEF